ncbi:MAG: Ig-like domain-containing protein, partial [Candidatus Fervidibacter sp.]|uniref:Ig-like domain-containing protein n=1 Tax=Candidatus Fervidibacter sp. TaxID=3100871 RepID=UPI00404BA06F
MPTSTTVTANVRDAVGNPVRGIPVFFSADEGRLTPIADFTDSNGVATTTLTSTNSTRRVRVLAKAIGLGGQEIFGFTIVSFVVGNLASIDLIPDRTDIPPNEMATATVIFNPASEMPNNVRFGAELIGAYGVLESVSTTLNGRATIRIRNNNPTNTQQTTRLTVRVIRQDGLEMTKSLDFNLLPSQVVVPVELQTDPPKIVVSNNDATTDPTHRRSLGNNPNNAVLTLIVRNLNANEQVSVVLESTDPKGLFVPPVGLAQNSMGSLSFNITDNDTGDREPTLGIISVTVDYYSSRKAQPVTIRATVNRGASFYGESAVSIFQVPGPVEKAFFAVDPLRIAVNTVTGEPTQARLIASVYDANDNPVPNERVSFAIIPTEVVPYKDILAGDAQHVSLTRYDLQSLSQYFNAQGSPDPNQNAWGPGGVPKQNFYGPHLQFHPYLSQPPYLLTPAKPPLVADGGIQQSEVFTDANGIATTLLTSVNVCQPVTVRMVPQSKPDLERTFTTLYYVSVDGAPQVIIEQGGLVNGPGATFTVAFRFNPASALPPGTRVWVRIHGTAHDGDEDGDGFNNEDPPGAINWDDDKDGRIDEDPAGDANGDNNNDDDFDGRTDEDPYGPRNADDDGDGRVDEDWNPLLIDLWQTVTVTEPGVIRVSITNSPSGPDMANGWKVIQVFVWNRD